MLSFLKPRRNSNPEYTRALSCLLLGAEVGVLVLSASLNAEARFRLDRPDFFEQGQDRFQEEIDRFQQPDAPPHLEVEVQSKLWSPVVLRQGKSVVWMPQGAVTHETKSVETRSGEIDFDIVSTTSKLGKFVVAFSDTVDAFSDTEPRVLLERVYRRIIEKKTGFRVQGDRPLSFKGYPGREFSFGNEQESITYRVLLAGDRLYVMAVNQDSKTPSSAATEFFFNSFQLY